MFPTQTTKSIVLERLEEKVRSLIINSSTSSSLKQNDQRRRRRRSNNIDLFGFMEVLDAAKTAPRRCEKVKRSGHEQRIVAGRGAKAFDAGPASKQVKIELPEEKVVDSADSSLIAATLSERSIDRVKSDLLEYAALSHMIGVNYRKCSFEEIEHVCQLCTRLCEYDPEFVLKVALYTRNVLNFRMLANLLIAYAASSPLCKRFLQKYYSAVINLPSDWLETLELYQVITSRRTIPKALAKVMKKRFEQFSDFHLLKHQQIVRILRKNEREEKNKICTSHLSVKTVIKLLHIKYPRDRVMRVLRLRYPKNVDEFIESELPGQFDHEMAGKRMRLDPISTWEREISEKGNHAKVWEKLLDGKCMGYMAILRNLRNLMNAHVSDEHMDKVIKLLENEEQVRRSKQFPYQFYTAHRQLTSMRYENGMSEQRIAIRRRLEEAIEKAFLISTQCEIPPIAGFTLIILDVENIAYIATTRKRLSSEQTRKSYQEMLLTLMIAYRCESSCLYLYKNGRCALFTIDENSYFFNLALMIGTMTDCFLIDRNTGCFYSTGSEEGTEQELTKSPTPIFESSGSKDSSNSGSSVESNCSSLPDLFEDDDGGGEQPTAIGFEEMLLKYMSQSSSETLNNIVIVSSQYEPYKKSREMVLHYRQTKNPQLLSMNLFMEKMAQLPQSTTHDLFVTGVSEKVLRYLSDRSGQQLIGKLDQIDKEFGLCEEEKEVEEKHSTTRGEHIRHFSNLPSWQNVRIFVSSTFIDMQNERNLLASYIFPELRKRARSLLINLYDIDLRWGVTETNAASCVKICMDEANRADIFIGIIGDRYGFNQFTYDSIDEHKYDWIRGLEKGASITELEIYAAGALGKQRSSTNKTKSYFFYLRDNSFLENVPKEQLNAFIETADVEKCKRHSKLKKEILSSGWEVFDNYPCTYGGFQNGLLMLNNLEVFGERVFNNVWNALKTMKENRIDCGHVERNAISLEMEYMNEKLAELAAEPIINADLNESIAKSLKSNTKAATIIEGPGGCGKTIIVSQVVQHFKTHSSNRHSLLYYLCDDGHCSYSLMLRLFVNQLSGKESQKYHNQDVPDNELYQQFICSLQQKQEATAVRILIAIDGIEWLKLNSDQFFADCIKMGAKLLLSTRSKMEFCVVDVECTTSFSLQQLSFGQRAKVTESIMSRFSKSLATDIGSNQMRQLISKRGAKAPLYLSLACQELRSVVKSYDEVSTCIAGMPSTFDKLINSSLERVTSAAPDRSVNRFLTVLFCLNGDIYEIDMMNILYLDRTIDLSSSSLENIIDNLDFDGVPNYFHTEFMRIRALLSGFLNPTYQYDSGIISFQHLDVKMSIFSYLTRDKRFVQFLKETMKLLAVYFHIRSDPGRKGKWSNPDPKCIIRLPYVAIRSGNEEYCKRLLGDVEFINARLTCGKMSELFKDYEQLTDAKTKNLKKSNERYKDMLTILRQNLHILELHKDSFLRLLLSSTDNPFFEEAKKIVMMNESGECSSVLNAISSPLPNFDQIYFEYGQSFTCMDVTREQLAAIGTESGTVLLLNTNSSLIIRRYHGHCDRVSFVKFLDKQRLLSASDDACISVWDVGKAIRIAHFDAEHKYGLTWIDFGHHLLASAGLDGNLIIRNVTSLAKVTNIRVSGQPITCVRFHPTEIQVFSVGWDKEIDCFNPYSGELLLKLNLTSNMLKCIFFCGSDTSVIYGTDRQGMMKVYGLREKGVKGTTRFVDCFHEKKVWCK